MKLTAHAIILPAILLVIIILGFITFHLFDRGSVVFTDLNTPTSPTIRSTDPFIGSISPDAVLVLYSNFTCPSCKEMSHIMQRLALDYNITIVWKDFPNDSLNPESTNAAIAAQCAGNQGYFWEYHDILHEHRIELGGQAYTDIAEMIDLNLPKFNRCLSGEKMAGVVHDSAQEAEDLSLTTAPTIFVNTERLTGAVSENDLRTLLDNLLSTEL